MLIFFKSILEHKNWRGVGELWRYLSSKYLQLLLFVSVFFFLDLTNKINFTRKTEKQEADISVANYK